MTQTGRNDPCHCGSGKKYKKCHGSVTSNAGVLQTAHLTGFRVAQDFRNRVHLKHIGPLIKGGWQLSPDEEERLRIGGLPIPKRVAGYLLIDTGAANSAIDEDVAQELRLRQVGQLRVGGLAGASTQNVYKAAIFLELGDIHGEKVAMSLHKEFVAVNKLRESHDAVGLKSPEGTPMRVIGLLGRDFLQFTKMSYDGLKGSWDMEVDPEVMRPWEGV